MVVNFLNKFKIELSLFFLILFVHGAFLGQSAWNQRSRLDPIFSFVEPGTKDTFSFRIDHLIDDEERGLSTGDWASGRDGHFFSNKAPGSIVLGLLPYIPLYFGERALGINPTTPRQTVINEWLINLAVSVLGSALAAVALYRFSLSGRLNSRVNSQDAAWIAIIYGFGTLVFPFDTSYWGHPIAAAFLLFAGIFFFRPNFRAAGFFSGIAVSMEYLTAASFGIFILALVVGIRRNRKNLRSLLDFLIGAAGPVILLLTYQKICFGGFLITAPSQSNPVFLKSTDIGGLFGSFSGAALFNLLLSPYRGLFPFMPVLCFVVPGVYQKIKSGQGKRVAFLLCHVGAYLVAISSFNGWDGGNSSGPRYLIVALPFLCMLLPPLSALGEKTKLAFLAAGAWSIFNMTIISFYSALAPAGLLNPLYGHLYSRLANDLHNHTLSPMKTQIILSEPNAWSVWGVGLVLVLGLAGIYKGAGGKAPVSWQTRIQGLATSVLLLAAGSLLLFRFLDPGLTPFRYDEAKIQVALDHHLAEGTLPAISPVIGSKGLSYGPAPQWFYFPIRLLTPNLHWVVRAHVVYATVGLLLFYAITVNALGKTAGSWFLLLSASSPFLFFYSRNCWDNTFLVLFCGWVLLAWMRLHEARGRGLGSWAAFGLGWGLAFDTHFMCIPLLAASALGVATIGRSLESLRRKCFCAAAALLPLMVVVLPYLVALWHQMENPPVRNPEAGEMMPFGTVFESAWLSFSSLGNFLGFHGMDYFYGETAIAQVSEHLGGWAAFGGTLSLGLVMGAWIVFCLGIFRFAIKRWPRFLSPVNHAQALATLSGLGKAPFILAAIGAFLVFQVLFFAFIRPDFAYPHYMMAAWWSVFMLIAWGIAEAPKPLRVILRALAAGCAVVNVLFIYQAQTLAKENSGLRSVNYGPSIDELSRLVEEFCKGLPNGKLIRIALLTDKDIHTPTLAYLFSHMPSCDHKSAAISGPGEKPDFLLRYQLNSTSSTETNARLELAPYVER